MEEQWPLIGCTTSEESTSDSEANHFNECLTVERVFPSVRGCTQEWESAPQCGRVCPSVGGCAPVWEGVPQCMRVCPSVGGCAQCRCPYIVFRNRFLYGFMFIYMERMQWAESTRPSAMLKDNLSPRPIQAEGFIEHCQLLHCCRLF